MVATGRQSAFDRHLASVPFKGQVLNLISLWWFEQTSHLAPNHVLYCPHPSAVVGKRCAREAGDCRDGRRRRHSSSRSQALTLDLFRCGTLDSRESASGAGRIDTSEAARCALRGDAFSA